MNGKIVNGTTRLVTHYEKEVENFKRCPFCNSGDIVPNQTLASVKSKPRVYWLNCNGCGATGPDRKTLNQAINKWESRNV